MSELEKINQSLSQADTSMLSSHTDELLERRKQMAVFDLGIEHTERLYVPQYLYDTYERLKGIEDSADYFFNKDTTPVVSLRKLFHGKEVYLRVRCKDMLLTRRHDAHELQLSSPGFQAFKAWLDEAVKIQVSNQISSYTIKKVIRTASTYKQLFKTLPESMQAVAALAETKEKSNTWNEYRSANQKIIKALRIMNYEGANRARNLPGDTVRTLDKYKAVVETALAQAILLPPLSTRQSDIFHGTWISGVPVNI